MEIQQYLHPTADLQARSSEYQTHNFYISVSLFDFVISFSETEPYLVAQVGLRLMVILLPQTPYCC